MRRLVRRRRVAAVEIGGGEERRAPDQIGREMAAAGREQLAHRRGAAADVEQDRVGLQVARHQKPCAAAAEDRLERLRAFPVPAFHVAIGNRVLVRIDAQPEIVAAHPQGGLRHVVAEGERIFRKDAPEPLGHAAHRAVGLLVEAVERVLADGLAVFRHLPLAAGAGFDHQVPAILAEPVEPDIARQSHESGGILHQVLVAQHHMAALPHRHQLVNAMGDASEDPGLVAEMLAVAEHQPHAVDELERRDRHGPQIAHAEDEFLRRIGPKQASPAHQIDIFDAPELQRHELRQHVFVEIIDIMRIEAALRRIADGEPRLPVELVQLLLQGSVPLAMQVGFADDERLAGNGQQVADQRRAGPHQTHHRHAHGRALVGDRHPRS